MQETICAKVSGRLLTKASRLFTGTLDGRIIEILQNSRRAGAMHVNVSNKDGFITVCDNGSGIDDFYGELDLFLIGAVYYGVYPPCRRGMQRSDHQADNRYE